MITDNMIFLLPYICLLVVSLLFIYVIFVQRKVDKQIADISKKLGKTEDDLVKALILLSSNFDANRQISGLLMSEILKLNQEQVDIVKRQGRILNFLK